MPEVLILTSTINEYDGVAEAVSLLSFRNFTPRLFMTGPGKINAAISLTRLLSAPNEFSFLLAAGTSGSLDKDLKAGDVVASAEALIGDWRHEECGETTVGVYGIFEYGPPTPERVAQMVLKSPPDTAQKLLAKLDPMYFYQGRTFSSDTFVAGQSLKLSIGKTYGCRICEMESGAVSFTAGLLNPRLPWLHLRVVADTLEDTLSDYFDLEKDMTKILGQRAGEALSALDLNWDLIF
ncbi:MAG: hypothetical protein LBP22_08295 [Deltaproteobacteria bacterium]|nr:hypothetical protein [Deltaproteobacteria bacterium]